jgi:hypothetical protein
LPNNPLRAAKSVKPMSGQISRGLNPWAVEGEWYRGTLHAHTTNSDGAMPPTKLVEHYAYAGADFVALTDHWKATGPDQVVGNPGPTVIRGIEVNTEAGSTAVGTNYHIVGLGVPAPIARMTGGSGPEAAQAYLDAIRDVGGVAFVAHPYWSGLTLRDFEGLHGYVGLEVWNADTEVHIGRGDSSLLWDDLLSHGHNLLGLGVDDCHRPGYDSVRGWTVVRAPDRSAASIVAAVAAGHFYATAGPEILDVVWDESAGTVTVRCSPARSVTLVADGTQGARLNAGPFGASMRASRFRSATNRPEGVIEGELLTGAVLHLSGAERYVRVQIEDDRGRRAWTNPIFRRA